MHTTYIQLWAVKTVLGGKANLVLSSEDGYCTLWQMTWQEMIETALLSCSFD